MINKKSLDAVHSAYTSQYFCKPLYGSYCFSEIPNTIKKLFGISASPALPEDALVFNGQEDKNVILLFIDGFGWRFLSKHMDTFPFLKRFAEKGVVSKITSQFPSTTVAHVTCIHTGLEVGQSGNYEWYSYEPSLDAMITPLLFSYAGDGKPLSLLEAGGKPEVIFPPHTLYQELARHGIESYVLQHKSFSSSPYSKWVCRGAQIVPFLNLSEALSHLNRIYKTPSDKKRYFFLYYGDIDAASHKHGPDSKTTLDVITTTMENLEKRLINRLHIKPDTSLIITADHGMTPTDPTTAVYVNQLVPQIENWIKRNEKGELLVPAGSPRDFFLHIKQEYINDAVEALRVALRGRAEVYPVQQLIYENYFGSQPPSQRFLDRVGSVVILSYPGESIFWYIKDKFEAHFYGHHGGLTIEEMETIFCHLRG
jgi:hypothetical protein